MLISRKKYDELYNGLLHKEQQLTDLRATLQEQAHEIARLGRELEARKKEIQTLNASLDATSAALEQTRNTLAVSEKARKQLLKERRRG